MTEFFFFLTFMAGLGLGVIGTLVWIMSHNGDK